ncbi:hypothetical protein BD779DRAFT_155483 [Infundibulicybe gibba]|nr:hypothetical protein BD779DRAFT_155483 [Infundibulicybe gibba]
MVRQLEEEHGRVLRVVKRRVDERKQTEMQLSDDPSSTANIPRFKQLKESEALQAAWDDYNNTVELLHETIPLLSDGDATMRLLAADEYTSLIENLSNTLSQTFPGLLTPPSPTAQLPAFLELKAGVGGSEATLFLGNLLRMYTRLAAARGWAAKVVGMNEVDGGGIRDAVLEVRGEGVYDALRWESGVHRVQRVPATEASGRVHTSTVAIVVLPLVDEDPHGQEELFQMEDVKVEVMRSRGAGGQHVNKTESAVRLTHIPTGITVSMQDERSQHQNKRRAFQILRSRLLDAKLTRDIAQRRATRQNLVRTADRSEKIRTYNYAQDRITDHRISLTLMNLASVLEGDALSQILDALKRNYDESVMEEMLME